MLQNAEYITVWGFLIDVEKFKKRITSELYIFLKINDKDPHLH